jgi:hypothetical protein
MHSRRIAKILGDIYDLAERDEISQGLLAGEKPDALAAVFSDISAKELLGLKPSGKKMDVVDEGLPDTGRGQG